jgi:hypothetical protein
MMFPAQYEMKKIALSVVRFVKPPVLAVMRLMHIAKEAV